MVGTWMLWQNGWGLGGRYHDWELDALAVRMGSGAQSCEEVGPGRAEGQRRKEGVGKRPGRCLLLLLLLLPIPSAYYLPPTTYYLQPAPTPACRYRYSHCRCYCYCCGYYYRCYYYYYE